jgi:putative oxidoreductase
LSLGISLYDKIPADMLKDILFGTIDVESKATNLGLAILRIFTGLSMAFAHGIGKIPPSESFISGIGDLGFPMPGLFGWAAGLAEFAGGILLALGLLTRPSALFLGFTMFVAAFLKHSGDGFGGQEKALMYLVIAILFVLTGSGRYGVDEYLSRWRIR